MATTRSHTPWIVLVVAAACSGGPAQEVIVTREQVGRTWPLRVNSARVACSDEGTLLLLGSSRYALDEAARAAGYPDARQVARTEGEAPLSLEPLRAACDGTPGNVAARS